MTAARNLIAPYRARLLWCLAAGLLAVTASAAAQWQVRPVPGDVHIDTPVAALRDGQPVIYAVRRDEYSNFGELVWSSDLGRTWTPQPFVSSDGSEITFANTLFDLRVAPQDSTAVYAFLRRLPQNPVGGACRLAKSTDGGITWTLLADLVSACLLVLDPGDPLRMYGINPQPEPFIGTLLKQSSDGGFTWSNVIASNLTSIGTQARVAAIAGDGQVYVGTHMGLYVSNGRGGSWEQILTGDVRNVVAEPWSSNPAVFVTTSEGVHVVRNRVATPIAFPGILVSLSLVPDPATHTSNLFVGYRAGLARNQPPSTVMTPFANGIGDNDSSFYNSISRVSSVADGAAWIASAPGGLAVCQSACEGGRLPAILNVIEFHNTDLNHYFLTANLEEAQQIDAGAAGTGWTRTNRNFKAYQGIEGSPLLAPTRIVCRFYGTPGRGPNSHFYTAFASECASVQQDPGWRLEDPQAFAIVIPKEFTYCEIPVYRAYNNRAAFNDSNHRYMTERSDYDAMVAAGWIGEGRVFCSLH